MLQAVCACAVQCRAAAGEGSGLSVRATLFGAPGSSKVCAAERRVRIGEMKDWHFNPTGKGDFSWWKRGHFLSKNGSSEVKATEGDVWCDWGTVTCTCSCHKLPGELISFPVKKRRWNEIEILKWITKRGRLILGTGCKMHFIFTNCLISLTFKQTCWNQTISKRLDDVGWRLGRVGIWVMGPTEMMIFIPSYITWSAQGTCPQGLFLFFFLLKIHHSVPFQEQEKRKKRELSLCLVRTRDVPVYVKLVLVKRTEKVRNIRLFLGTIIYLGMAKAAYIECLTPQNQTRVYRTPTSAR